MNLAVLGVAKKFEKVVTDNSPTILAAVGVVGVSATAFFTAKASVKAVALLGEEAERRERMGEADLTSKVDVVKVVWKEYIPAFSSLSLSIACIICANRISARRATAMAIAYSMSEKKFTDYKDKITEKLGISKEQTARDEIVQEKVDANPLNQQVIIMGNGEFICYDVPTGRYFKSNMETLRSKENELNQSVIHNGYATLSDFYVMLGLKDTPYSEEVGWTTDDLLQIDYTTALTDDKQPCLAIDYKVSPIRGYK